MPTDFSPLKTIAKEYENLRLRNEQIAADRQTRIFKEIPACRELHDQMITLSMKHAMQNMYGEPTDEAEYHSKMQDIRLAREKLLADAGYPADYLEPIYRCPICKDKGYVNGESCVCMKERQIEALYQQSGIRDFLQANNFSTLSSRYYEGEDLIRFEKAVSCCHKMIDHFDVQKDNLLFYGTVGCGKSFLSGCVAKELLDRGYSVLYFSGIAFFDELHQSSLYSGVQDLYNYDLIIIDDLGAEMTNSFVTTALFSFLNERVLRQKATIISTNLNLSEIRDRYSDRIASRIVESFQLLRLSGPDIRIRKRLQHESED